LVGQSFIPGAPIAAGVQNLGHTSVILVSALVTVGDAFAGVLDVDAVARAAHFTCDKVSAVVTATFVVWCGQGILCRIPAAFVTG
jgi:hypothetical protein